MEDYRYTRLERRKKYISFFTYDDEVKNKKNILRLHSIQKKNRKRIKKKKYLIINKDRSQFNTVNDITVAHVFKHDEAIRLRRRTPIKDLNLSMVKMTKDNQFILV